MLSQLEGEWNVWTVGGKKVTGENRPYINFSLSEGRIYGNNGCNTVNGDFTTGQGPEPACLKCDFDYDGVCRRAV